MENIKIGTSGFDYLEWQGAFYPEDIKRTDFLTYYSTQFDTLELNFSYYRMPEATQLSRLMERSEGRIDFSIKGHSTMTHTVDPLSWKDSVKEYISAIEPLLKEEKLYAVLLQFPYSFHYTPERRKYLNDLTDEMKNIPLVVEFRNGEWLNKRVFDALKKKEIGFCSFDAPRIKGVPSTVDMVTSPISYIRFHGRNDKTWWGSDAAARFDYKYSEKELIPWADRIISIMKNSSKIRIYFNNHRRGQATENAFMLKNLLKLKIG